MQPNALIEELCHGKCTSLILDGKSCAFASAETLKLTKKSCSGRLGALEFRIDFSRKDGWFLFSVTLKNTGRHDLTIGDITLFTHSEREGKKRSRNVFAFNDTLASENYVEAAKDLKGKHTSRPLCLIYESEAERSFFSAQRTFDKNDVCYTMQFDCRDGRLKELKCMVPVLDYLLPPDSMITTDQVCIAENEAVAPRKVLNDWAETINQLYHPHIPETAPAGFLCGWLISTKAEKTDSQIRRVMASASVLKKLGAEYIWTSIDNLPDGMPGNWLESNRDNFHDGVPAFLKEITENGFKPGLWIAPYAITERSKDFPKVREFLLKDRNGEPESRHRWFWGTPDEHGLLPKVYALDSDRKESYDYIGHVLDTYTKWGVRYYMCDFLVYGFHSKENPDCSFAQESHRKFLRSLAKHVTPDTFLLSAVGSSLSNIGAFHSSRIGMDYGEARQLEPNFESYPANYIINGSFGSSGAPNRNAIQNLAMWGFAHERFFLCNSNVMTVDQPIPLNEAQISASLFGISPSPVFFQDDVARMCPERLALLKKVLPRCPGMPEAADLFTKTDAQTDFLRIFRLHIRKPWGEWTICAVFNLNNTFRKVKLNAELLELNPEKEYRMYEFWEECYMGTFRKERSVEIPGMCCKVYRLAEKMTHPWILSTDIHVRQGEAELEDVRWDAEKMVLSGIAGRVKGERGTLFLISPDCWMERHFNKGMLVAKSALDHSLIIKLPLNFTADRQKWKVEFTPCKNTIQQESKAD